MIKLLRHIRKSLIMENKTPQYLKYAIGEILLVVIGILIALQVNNWNENLKKLKISQEIELYLKAELEESLQVLEQTYQFNLKSRNLSQQFINGEVNFDSLALAPEQVFLYTGFAPVTLDLPILERELSSEKIIIGKEELVHQLRVIQNDYNRVQKIITSMERLWSNQVAPYYTKTNTMVIYNQFLNKKKIDLVSLQPILEDPEYKNLVAAINSFSLQLVASMKDIQSKIKSTLNYLEKER